MKREGRKMRRNTGLDLRCPLDAAIVAVKIRARVMP